MKLFNRLGQPVQLGEELGRGGEGAVYTLQGDTRKVAKVYHSSITNEKVDKLKAMVANGLGLDRFTAWPLATLHEKPNGMVKGFVMPRVTGYREVHELYGPAHRKVQFPHADWSFLILAARNIAAAFQAIHDCGYVVGDVNQSGILISQEALCHLIDTDSFQIRLGNKIYYCEVGTPHFTPPELQERSFRAILRTEDHDNFGLAVIIFQLLFMGRHPYAGRYLGSGDMPIERAIKEHRFAFGSKAGSKQMQPPPNTLDLAVCTLPIVHLFERAFSEEAAHKQNRPKASEWLDQLNILSKEICNCSQNSVHRYHKNLSYCPWCKLENTSGIVYFLSYANSSQEQLKFDLEKIWLELKAIKIPSQRALLDPDFINVIRNPLPDYAKPPQGFLGFINSFWNFHDDKGERKKRESNLRKAEQEWKSIVQEWQSLNSDSNFTSTYRKLEKAYSDYKNLPERYQAERRQALLKIYLERFFIENAEIPNIGKKRAIVLASYGIETAADVTYDSVASVPGFGPVLTQKLVEWRNQLELRFERYKPSVKELASLDSLNQKYVRHRNELESKLLGGKAQLENIRNLLIKKREQVYEVSKILARKLAQARADMSVYT